MSGGTESIPPSPQNTPLPKPTQMSRIPKISRSSSVHVQQLSPALLSAKLTTLLSLSSARGRDISSRSPSPRTPGRLSATPSSPRGVMPSPATPASVGRPSSAGANDQRFTPGSRIATPFVFNVPAQALKSSKTNNLISPRTKPVSSTPKTPAEHMKNTKIGNKLPAGNSNKKPITKNTDSMVNTVKLGNTKNTLKRSSTLGNSSTLVNSSRKSISTNALYKNPINSTVKPPSTNNKENTGLKRPPTKSVPTNTLSKARQPLNALKSSQENKTIKTSTSTTKGAKPATSSTKAVLTTSKSVSCASKPLSKSPSTKCNSSNNLDKTPKAVTTNGELTSNTSNTMSNIKTPSRRLSYPFPVPSKDVIDQSKRLSLGGNKIEIKPSLKTLPLPPKLNFETLRGDSLGVPGEQSESKEDATELSVPQTPANTSVLSDISISKSPNIFSPSRLDENPSASTVWALAAKLVNSNPKAEEAEVSSFPKEVVEISLSPNALAAEYLTEVNEFLETKEAQMKLLTSSHESINDLKDTDFDKDPTKHEDQRTHLQSSGIDNSASSSSYTLMPMELTTPEVRSPAKSPRKKSPVCVVLPFPPASLAPPVDTVENNSHCPWCDRDIQDTVLGYNKVTRSCGHSFCRQCYSRATAANLSQCYLCYKTILEKSRKSL